MLHMHQHQGQGLNTYGSSTSFPPHMYGLHPVLMSQPPPPPPGPPPLPPPVWHDQRGYCGKRWLEVVVPDKGWNEDHPVRDEQGAATMQLQKDESGGSCKKRRVEKDKVDVPHTPHVNIYSIGIQQTLDPRRSIKWGLEKLCPDVLPVHQIEDVSRCRQDKAVSGWHCGENLNTLCAASTCSRFDEFAKALPQELHRHFRDNSAPYTLAIACCNGRHKSVSWARCMEMMLTGQYSTHLVHLSYDRWPDYMCTTCSDCQVDSKAKRRLHRDMRNWYSSL